MQEEIFGILLKKSKGANYMGPGEMVCRVFKKTATLDYEIRQFKGLSCLRRNPIIRLYKEKKVRINSSVRGKMNSI